MQIAVTVTKDGAAVTEYTPGEIYDVEVAAYEGSVNCWMHSSAGEVMPDNPETHAQANCPEASYSKAAAASHMFIWTAPDAAEPVTVSIAQAMGAGDNYKTNTVRPPLLCFASSVCMYYARWQNLPELLNILPISSCYKSSQVQLQAAMLNPQTTMLQPKIMSVLGWKVTGFLF